MSHGVLKIFKTNITISFSMGWKYDSFATYILVTLSDQNETLVKIFHLLDTFLSSLMVGNLRSSELWINL